MNTKYKPEKQPFLYTLEQEVSDMELSETEDVINNYINQKMLI